MASPVADHYGCASGGVIRAGRYNVSQFWRDLPAGWSNVTVAGAKPPNAIAAYSGMAVDASGGKVYLFGGGHNDYFGNEVWELDLESRAAWIQHYAPSLYSNPTVPDVEAVIDITNWPGAIMSGGQPFRPISRHTYKSVMWIDSLSKFTGGAGSTYSGNGEYLWPVWRNSNDDWWLYNPAPKTWEYQGSKIKTPAYDPSGNSNAAYSRSRDRVYAAFKTINNRLRLNEWNPATNVWTLHTEIENTRNVNYWIIAVDDANDRVLALVESTNYSIEMWEYPLSTRVWTLLPSTGTEPTTAYSDTPQMVVSSKTGKLYHYEGGLTMRTYDPVTGVWSSSTFIDSTVAQVCGRFYYDRIREVALLVAVGSSSIRLYAYKD